MNPFLPSWEYIPDGEPRVFGDRVYLYGSHDRAGSNRFCDSILKVWSAPLKDLNNWRDEGTVFSTRTVGGHADDVSWSDNELYAPDVVEKGGKYYLYAYVVGAPGCVAVSDSPAGPFKLISQIKAPPGAPEDFGHFGQYQDPGVLVDDDGKVYIYWGYKRSYMAQLNPDNMYEILPGTLQADWPLVLATQFDQNLRLFLRSGDAGGFYFQNIPGFDPLMSILFWMGLGIAASRFLRLPDFALMCWFALGLFFGGVLTIDAPSAQRLTVMLPTVCLFGAVCAAEFWRAATTISPTPHMRRFLPTGAALCMIGASALIAYLNLDLYFKQYANGAQGRECARGRVGTPRALPAGRGGTPRGDCPLTLARGALYKAASLLQFRPVAQW